MWWIEDDYSISLLKWYEDDGESECCKFHLIEQEVISRLVMIYRVMFLLTLYEAQEKSRYEKKSIKRTTPDEPPTWPIMFLLASSWLVSSFLLWNLTYAKHANIVYVDNHDEIKNKSSLWRWVKCCVILVRHWWSGCDVLLLINSRLSLLLQMVQAIQVLRFHLLELEKVSSVERFKCANNPEQCEQHSSRRGASLIDSLKLRHTQTFENQND